MEGKRDEEIGEECGSGWICEGIPSPTDFINAGRFLLLLGEQEVRHGVPEGGKKSQDKSVCKAGESEIGSPVPHLFRFEIEDNVGADYVGGDITNSSSLTSLKRAPRFTLWLSCITLNHTHIKI